MVIFSHAIGKDRMAYSAMLSEIASYGYLVISINHNDKSCTHTIGYEQEVEEDKIIDSADGSQ